MWEIRLVSLRKTKGSSDKDVKNEIKENAIVVRGITGIRKEKQEELSCLDNNFVTTQTTKTQGFFNNFMLQRKIQSVILFAFFNLQEKLYII